MISQFQRIAENLIDIVTVMKNLTLAAKKMTNAKRMIETIEDLRREEVGIKERIFVLIHLQRTMM